MRSSCSLALALAVLAASADRGHADSGPRRYPPVADLLADPLASPYRAHVARMGAARVRPDGDDAELGGHDLRLFDEVPVAGEAGAQVRLVSEHDHARVLVWVEAADLSWAMAAPVRLRGAGDTGVWLSTGAPVTVRGRGARRTVTYRDDAVRIEGAVAASALTRVFATTVEWRGSRPMVARDLRLAPGGPALYPGPLEVAVVVDRGPWIEVEHASRYLRIRGWVRARDLSPDDLSTTGTGGGSGFGMSDTAMIEVPASACLYDRQGGEAAGLQLAPARRYVAHQDGAWTEVYVGSAWGTLRLWVHATGSGEAAQWDLCR